MIEGWSMEEAIKFYTYYLHIKRVRVSESHHEGRLHGKGTFGEKSVTVDDPISSDRHSLLFSSKLRVSCHTLRSTSNHCKLSIRVGHRLGWIKNIRRNLSTSCDAAC
jgi:hypothetical protein